MRLFFLNSGDSYLFAPPPFSVPHIDNGFDGLGRTSARVSMGGVADCDEARQIASIDDPAPVLTTGAT